MSENSPVEPATPAGTELYVVTAASRPGALAQAEANGQSIPFSTTGGQGVAGPAELLAASLAACLLKNVERMSGLLPFEVSGARVQVTLTRQAAPPRFIHAAYHLTVETAEPARRLALLHKNLRKFGTVVNTLAAVMQLEGRLTAQRPDGCLEQAPAADVEGA